MRKIGVWIVGALGSISVTVIVGALAARKGMLDNSGMVTATTDFGGLDLVPVEALEFGGCDVRTGSLVDSAVQLCRDAGGIDPGIVQSLEKDLESIEQHISSGTILNSGEAIGRLARTQAANRMSVREEIDHIVKQLNEFKLSNQFQDVVVVNLASTEPPLELKDCHEKISTFEDCVDRNNRGVLRASTIYSYAAIQAHCPYINFTPSNGALFPAIVKLAERNGVPVMGNDGKTGETLVKSALAPMFKCRNLEILGWEGFNILGNMDGKILDHPENKQSKINSKDAVLSKILGYSPHSRVHINYAPSLADQKTAWDFIHFKGFLGAKMSLQFIWQGYDSLLAAPLILDLVRLMELAHRRGEAGPAPHLASFFKDPLGSNEHGFHNQYQMLMNYVRQADQSSKDA